MFQKPPEMFHLEHPHGGGAFTEIAGVEVVLHHVRLMSLANDLCAGTDGGKTLW